MKQNEINQAQEIVNVLPVVLGLPAKLINDRCKMAEQQSESNTILKQILELMKKEKEERKDGFIYKSFPVQREDHVDVFVRVSIGGIGDIDAVRQEFQCKLYMKLRWEESRLKGKELSNVDVIDWYPRYYFINAVDIQEHEVARKIEPGDPPQVMLRCSIIGTFKEVLEINKFPFDYHDLSLTLTSKCRTKEMTFVKDPKERDSIRTEYFYPRQEWDLKPHVISTPNESETGKGSSSNVYPEYEIRMNVMRKCKFYVSNVFLVMGLITALTFASFTVGADLPGDRVQISLTLLLTSVAFKYYVQQFVPTVSYFTLLDEYILSCMAFQFFMTLHNMIGGVITDSRTLSTFEWTWFVIAVLTFTLINAYFVYLSVKYIKEAKEQEEKDKDQYYELNPEKLKNKMPEDDRKESIEGSQVPVNKNATAKIENDEAEIIDRNSGKLKKNVHVKVAKDKGEERKTLV